MKNFFTYILLMPHNTEETHANLAKYLISKKTSSYLYGLFAFSFLTTHY